MKVKCPTPDCNEKLTGNHKQGYGFTFRCQKCGGTYVLKDAKSYELVLKPIPDLEEIL
jgi:transposase-like protein